MTQSLRRIRGALGMGLTWAVAWAIAGLLIGVSSILLPFLPWDAFFAFYDAPQPTLARPGFIGGALFSVVLGIAGRRRRFDELSMPRFAAWGALGGLLLSMVPDALVAAGLATLGESSALALGEITLVLAAPLSLLGSASAAGSLTLARRSQPSLPRSSAAPRLEEIAS